MSNIIDFPKHIFGAPPKSAEELQQKLEEYRHSYSDEISEILWGHVLREMMRSGCEFANDMPKYFPSMLLVLESMRSLHLQSQGIHHPLQDYAKEEMDVEAYEEKAVDIDEEME